MSNPVRVQIVEREHFFRLGLSGGLATDSELEVVSQSATAEEGYRHADEQMPDVLLVGTTLPGRAGPDRRQEFRRRFPSIAVIVVAAQESDDELFAAIRAGASAYCGKDIEQAKLVALIKRSATGEYVINEQLLDKPYVAARVLEQFRSATTSDLAPTSAFAPLTDRELGDPAQGLRRDDQRRDRLRARDQRPDGQEPRHLHPAQAGRQRPHPGRRDRPQARLALDRGLGRHEPPNGGGSRQRWLLGRRHRGGRRR
jgi:DNA-binding NarL/FixJ family response regulator